VEDDFVMKRLMMKRSFDQKDISSIHKEAIIMERLSSSPHILGIYGYCGITVFVESMESDIHNKIIPGEGLVAQEELDKLDNVYPNNTFTASEKLQISLSMAESLVDLHEFIEGGVVVHADTHIEQWLLAPDKILRLNDFNNAKVMQWNRQNQEFCLTKGSYGGVWRAPEEYVGNPQDETKDTYSFGNGVYTLLTGLWPFYDEEFQGMDHDIIQDAIINGKRPFIDRRYWQRSFIEQELIKIMEACWAPKSRDRPSMSQVVDDLYTIKAMAQKKGELEQSNWIRIPETHSETRSAARKSYKEPQRNVHP
jgi:serine/threonine protein kinase